MRILYFHQHFVTPAMSGGTRSYEMARRLVEHGHQVAMVCGKVSGGNMELKDKSRHDLRCGTIDGIEIIQIDLPYSNYFSFLKRAIIFVRFALHSVVLALKLDYDLLFATSTPLTAALPGIVMKWFRRKPFVFEVRDLWPELPRAMGVIKNPIALGAMSALEWLAYRHANAVIGLSPGIVEGIHRRGRLNLSVTMIPNGSDLELFRPADRQELRLEGIGPNDIAAVFTGAHGIANGLDAVLSAATELLRRGRNDIKLVFIGDGKMKPVLQAKAHRDNLTNCLFLSPLPKVQLGRLLGMMDVGLMTLANVPAFYYGTSPNKFFDYIASGLPILNNYPGWLANLIAEHKCGIIVPPDNPPAFAQALIDLADNPAGRGQMGMNARRLAETCFDRTVLADRFVSWLEQFDNRVEHC